MISVIIPTHESERALVRTLACLVSGATAGLIREVILADGGSRDDTHAVGDVAGCRFLALPGSIGARLSAAAKEARSDWLLFLLPGTVIDPGWVEEVHRFLETADGEITAAFRRARAPASRASALSDMLDLAAVILGAKPRPEQGLLIHTSRYRALGGHRDREDAARDLIHRAGQRIVTFRSSAVQILDSVK
jgi:glycosyltransferase involved in cell wall biosynthesis